MSGNITLRQGLMTKRAQGKKKSSPKNWKERFFILTPSELSYWDKDGGPDTSGSEKKGSILVNTIHLAEEVKDGSFDRQHIFQVVHGSQPLTLYVQARDATSRSQWLQSLRELIQFSPARASYFHPSPFDGKTWFCCGGVIDSKGCKNTTTIDL